MASRLLRLSLRGLLAWGLLAAGGYWLARPIVDGLSPFMESAVQAMQSDYTAQLSVHDAPAGLQLVMRCTAKRELSLANGRGMHFLRSFDCAQTDAVHVLVPLIIFLAVLLGWPTMSRRESLRRALAAGALLPIVLGLTTPVLLVGLVAAELHPESYSANAQLNALLQPFVFVEMGGGWLLALVGAAICIRYGARGSEPQARPKLRPAPPSNP